MKKIGILFGKENTFPQAFIDRVNHKNIDGIKAEAVSIEMVAQGAATDYAVIIDRISQDVPFYRAFLKNAALSGTAVLNNPFWWSADEKFFNNALAQKIGVAVPNTVLLPSHARPEDTDENSFKNLKFPQNWDNIFEYVGFPAYMKPFSGGGWKNVYRVENADDLFRKHSETGQLVMMLQEEIVFDDYFRCYYLSGDRVHIMRYEPRNPHHLRYVKDAPAVKKSILKKVHEGVIQLNRALGYDFNTVEFAIRDGEAYAIDFCNPAPDADLHSVGEDNFEWIVENAAQMAIDRAKKHKDGEMNLSWGSFITEQADGKSMPKKRGRPALSKGKALAQKGTFPKAASANKIKSARKTANGGNLQSTPKRMMASDTGSEVKRGPGRPRKHPLKNTNEVSGVKRGRGRPRKVLVDPPSNDEAKLENQRATKVKQDQGPEGQMKTPKKRGPKPGSKNKVATKSKNATNKIRTAKTAMKDVGRKKVRKVMIVDTSNDEKPVIDQLKPAIEAQK